MISKNAFVTLNTEYSTASCTDFLKVRSYGTVDLRYTPSFLHNAFRLIVFADDIFKTRRDVWTMYGQNVINTKDCYNLERRIGITLTYNLNVRNDRYKGTGAGNDEKRRL